MLIVALLQLAKQCGFSDRDLDKMTTDELCVIAAETLGNKCRFCPRPATAMALYVPKLHGQCVLYTTCSPETHPPDEIEDLLESQLDPAKALS